MLDDANNFNSKAVVKFIFWNTFKFNNEEDVCTTISINVVGLDSLCENTAIWCGYLVNLPILLCGKPLQRITHKGACLYHHSNALKTLK